MLTLQVQLIQKQLHDLQLDRTLGSQLMLSPEHPYHTVLLRDLKAQLEALKTQREDSGREGKGTSQQPTYEIYARTEAAKFAHISKVGRSVNKHGVVDIFLAYRRAVTVCMLP